MTFEEYMNQPCDTEGCALRATHNQDGAKVCNQHLDPERPAFARNG